MYFLLEGNKVGAQSPRILSPRHVRGN